MYSGVEWSVTPRPIDSVVGRVLSERRARGRRIIVLSEYGLSDVNRPVHINRVLPDAGWVAVRNPTWPTWRAR